MTKFLRSRHVPLELKESQAIEKGLNEFIDTSTESGSALKDLRESRGWSHDDLANRVGLDAEYIELMEKGQRPITLTFAKMFGDVFDADYHDLL